MRTHRHGSRAAQTSLLCAVLAGCSLLSTPLARSQEATPADDKASAPSLLLLDPTEKVWSLQVTSGSRLTVREGDVVIDSTHDKALWNADASIEALKGRIRVVGGANYLGKTSTKPEPLTHAAPIDDPIAAFKVPPPQAVRSQQKLFLNNEGDVTLQPGIYSGGIFATGRDSTVTLQPGVYVINGGDFFVSGLRLQGKDVTIVMGGAAPGRFWCASGAELDLAPPAEGDLKNMVLISRAKGWNMIQIDGTRGRLAGLVYAPEAGIGLSAESQIVFDRLICANLSLALKSEVEVTGREVAVAPPAAETEAETQVATPDA